LAAVISGVQPVTALQLAQVDPVRWREERPQLGKLRQARIFIHFLVAVGLIALFWPTCS
jgi:hypothetical protein